LLLSAAQKKQLGLIAFQKRYSAAQQKDTKIGFKKMYDFALIA